MQITNNSIKITKYSFKKFDTSHQNHKKKKDDITYNQMEIKEDHEFKRLADNALETTKMIIDKCGPRLTGSDSCLKSSDLIFSLLKKNCDSVHIDQFYMHPDAFMYFIKVAIYGYLVAAILLALDFLYLSFLILGLSFIAIYYEYLKYYEFYDIFFEKKEGRNVYGVIEPKNEVKKTIIYSGHHDSAHIFNFYENPKDHMKYEIRGIIALIYLFFSDLLIIFIRSKITTPVFISHLIIVVILAIVFIAPLYHFLNPMGTQGAGDNLASVATGIELSKYFSLKKPKNTKIIFCSFDAEEAGLRGSRNFFKTHKNDFDVQNTFHFNVECTYFIEDLKFLLNDINGSVNLSKEMSSKCVEIAHQIGYDNAILTYLPFLAGGTDAAESTKIGIQATTVLGVPFEYKEGNPFPPYHTHLDVPDSIDPKILQAVAEIFVRFVEDVDGNIYK